MVAASRTDSQMGLVVIATEAIEPLEGIVSAAQPLIAVDRATPARRVSSPPTLDDVSCLPYNAIVTDRVLTRET